MSSAHKHCNQIGSRSDLSGFSLFDIWMVFLNFWKKLTADDKKAGKISQGAELMEQPILALCILMNSSFWFDTISLEWFIMCIKGSGVIFNCYK